MKITKIESIVVKMPMLLDGNAVPHPGGRPMTAVEVLLLRIDTLDELEYFKNGGILPYVLRQLAP